MMRRFLLLLSVMCLGSVAVGAEKSESMLWRAYAQGTQKKQKKLKLAMRHVHDLQRNASQLTGQESLRKDSAFSWLVRHRIPARLVVEKELKRVPEGASLRVLLALMQRLGGPRLWSYLPRLLKQVRSRESEIMLLNAMGRYGSKKHMKAIREFIKQSKEDADELVLMSAAKALSRAGRKEDRALIKKIAPRIKRPKNEVKLMLAVHRCGDKKIGKKIAKMIVSQKSSPDLRRMLMNHIAEKPYGEGVMAVAKVAKESPRDKDRFYALSALRRIRETIPRAPGSQVGVEKSEERDPPEFVDTDKAEKKESSERISVEKMSSEQRSELIQAVLSAWKEHAMKEGKPHREIPTNAQPLRE